MNTFVYAARLLEDFSKKMQAAGFTDGSFEEFVRQLPDTKFGDASKGLARVAYLAHLGLVNLQLQSGLVKMYDSSKCGEGESWKFREGNRYHYKVEPEDLHLFDEQINLETLFLMSPFPKNTPVKSLTLKSVLDGLKDISSTKIVVCSFWHGEWLMHHQEFIPKSWWEIINKGGRIIFPKVRLVTIPRCGEAKCTIYPYLRSQCGTRYAFEYCQDLQLYYGAEEDPGTLCRGKDFIVCYRMEDEK